MQVEVAQSKPIRPGTGTIASQKLKTRRLQMVTKQRERLEAEVAALEAEVKSLVRRLRVDFNIDILISSIIAQELKVLNQ